MRVLLMLAFMIQQGGYLRWFALLFVALGVSYCMRQYAESPQRPFDSMPAIAFFSVRSMFCVCRASVPL